jgi:hypothetical protein
VAKTIQAIGKCAIRMPEVSSRGSVAHLFLFFRLFYFIYLIIFLFSFFSFFLSLYSLLVFYLFLSLC